MLRTEAFTERRAKLLARESGGGERERERESGGGERELRCISAERGGGR